MYTLILNMTFIRDIWEQHMIIKFVEFFVYQKCTVIHIHDHRFVYQKYRITHSHAITDLFTRNILPDTITGMFTRNVQSNTIWSQMGWPEMYNHRYIYIPIGNVPKNLNRTLYSIYRWLTVLILQSMLRN